MSPHHDLNPKLNQSSGPFLSMSEAEEQAVLCLDSAIESIENGPYYHPSTVVQWDRAHFVAPGFSRAQVRILATVQG
ncbi:hypothetical protein E2C01_033241 [Portunus trituberculatus]|uniref:Uncharacterized protein n=1 Tax=Portunus trituberculatus TaxID=210409 RepID=A0A5B7F2Y0_PORTR|nr:hypothetical protein [Portunus trituberculatus]